MKGSRSRVRLALACVVMLPFTAAAEAQDAIRFIASNGNDANPCTRARPCRTLQAGIDAAPANGEVQILDSGFYGTNVVIGKSVTVSAVGVSASVGAGPATNAVTISGPGLRVVLRGLRLRGRNDTLDGIRISQAAAVHIDGCTVERFAGHGISLAVSSAEVFVGDSVSRTNGGDGLYSGSANPAALTIDNSRFENNGDDGLDVDTAQASVARSVMSGNRGDGVDLTAGRMNVTWSTSANNRRDGFRASANGAQLTLEFSLARGNGGAGLSVTASASARISNSVFTGNNVGIRNQGTIETRGNSLAEGNVTADAVTPSPLTPIDPM